MSNNLDITRNDFENICRTCLSREDLNPLYENYLAEMLMVCTVVKFAENDGLPSKICSNCINEINKAFSFARRCETTDKIVRNCVLKLETEVAINPSHSQQAEPTINTEEEMKPEIIYQTVTEVSCNYECMEEVKQEEDVEIEFEENGMKVEVETVKIECNETYDDPVQSNEEQDEVEAYYINPDFKNKHRCINSQIEGKCLKDDNRGTYDNSESFEADDNQEDNSDSRLKCKIINFQINDDQGLEKSNNSGSRSKRRCTISQIEEKNTKDDHNETFNDPVNESYEEEDDDADHDVTYSEKPDNFGFRFKLKTTNLQIPVPEQSKSSNQLYQCQEGIRIGNKSHISEVCSTTTNQSSDVKRHMRIHTGKKPFICEFCGKAFTKSSHLQTHLRIHTGEKPFSCEVCSKGFTHKINLIHHMRIHTGKKPYICEVCSKGFSQNHSLKDHMRVHTGEKPYTCKVCSKAFSLSHDLQIHMRSHTGEKPYPCEVCRQSFSQKINLITHMRMHTGEKPHTCEVCSKAFSHSSDLKRHLKIHTGDKPYTCKICNNKFASSSYLTVHNRRMHTGEKPYTCKVCSKKFATSFNLTVHNRIHTGDKPYTCKVCSKAFSQFSSLQSHLRIHTGDKPYTCNVCNKKFASSSYLTVHNRIHKD